VRKDKPGVEALQDEVKRLRAHSEALQTRLYELQTAHRLLQGEDEEYSALRHRIREVARELIPAEQIVLVVSKGDSALVDLYGREAWPFPRQADGRYAGYYPKRDLSAIAHLEAMRARGAGYLLLPETSRWWLDHYPAFRRHLEGRYDCVHDDPESCVIYAIGTPVVRAGDPLARFEQVLDDFLPVLGEDPSILDWTTGFSLEAAFPSRTVFSPPADKSVLPYLDNTVEVVAVCSDDEDMLVEAKRVAAKVVANFAALDSTRDRRWLRWKRSPGEMPVPSVSIIIPFHDGAAYTASCLTTLQETLPAWFRGEILLVSDPSSDETAALLRRYRRRDNRIRVVRNRSIGSSLAACNRGAQAARGDYLLFLNTDTVLLPGWFAPLLSTFNDYPAAGVVGGKILFEDGTLQEAGALVFSDVSVAKIGHLDPDVEAPLYQYPREVDYVSAAFLMTPRALFHEQGGFDPQYECGYYAHDYSFAVRASGRKVYYQPESVIVQIDGASAGTDLSPSQKENQVLSETVFAKKWQSELRKQPERPDPFDWRAGFALAGTVRGA
jgi:GT2 family glycosyltransferase